MLMPSSPALSCSRRVSEYLSRRKEVKIANHVRRGMADVSG